MLSKKIAKFVIENVKKGVTWRKIALLGEITINSAFRRFGAY
jgi:hypothetical protein